MRFETDPGEQMQTDWEKVCTVVAGAERAARVSVSRLGLLRRFHFWATESEDAEHAYEGVVRAFEHFGGATGEVLVDNQKSAVIEHRFGESVRFHERFLDLAGHYSFRPRACRPYRAQTKGKAKRELGYSDFLTEALSAEWQGRHLSGYESRFTRGRFPWVKTLEQFDFRFQPSIDRKVIREFCGALVSSSGRRT